ncbi:MAG: PilZ domain-containing protein [Candidatus Acidiferrum sp.]
MNRRRSERVPLQLRVVVETEIEEGKRVRLDAFTVVVNAHGGLLEMGLKLPKGHPFFVTNPAAGVQRACKVVGIRSSMDGLFAVGFEFNTPTPQFWPIALPPTDWGTGT